MSPSVITLGFTDSRVPAKRATTRRAADKKSDGQRERRTNRATEKESDGQTEQLTNRAIFKESDEQREQRTERATGKESVGFIMHTTVRYIPVK